MPRLFSLLILAALALTAGPAAAAPQAAGGLAVVVDGSPALTQAWLGTSRLAAMDQALEVELTTLPLGVEVSLWLGGSYGGRPAIPPTASGKLKGLRLSLPAPPPGGPGPAPALAAARRAVAGAGGGAVIIITDARRPPPDLEPGDGFLHVVALGPPDQAGAWRDLVLRGGGSYFEAQRPVQARRALHHAIRLALSPATLEVRAFDPENRPLVMVYQLQHSGAKAIRHRGLTGRPVQAREGLYKLFWPPKTGIGPAKPPARAEVTASGRTVLWAGGKGELSVKAVDEQDRPADWLMSVASRTDGAILTDRRRAPFTLEAPAGLYGVRSQSPALEWEVEVPAAGRVSLTAGALGWLRPALEGPGGRLRLPYTATPTGFANRPSTGYTGDPLALLSGEYRLSLEVAPGLTATVKVPPGGEATPDLGRVGGLEVTGQVGTAPHSFVVIDRAGRQVARGAAGRTIFALPGEYGVVMQGREQAQWIRVRAGDLTVVAPPPATE